MPSTSVVDQKPYSRAAAKAVPWLTVLLAAAEELIGSNRRSDLKADESRRETAMVSTRLQLAARGFEPKRLAVAAAVTLPVVRRAHC